MANANHGLAGPENLQKTLELMTQTLGKTQEALVSQGQKVQVLEGQMAQMESLLHRAVDTVFPSVALMVQRLEARNSPSPKVAPGAVSIPANCCAPTPDERALGEELVKAVEKGREGDVEWLLKAGADVSVCDSDGLTALHWAACKGREDQVSSLLVHGADVMARTTFGCTPLHWAACNDRQGRCVVLLLRAGTDIQATNNDLCTALHGAARCGNMAAVTALLAAGASTTARDINGQTPYEVAWGEEFRKVLRPEEPRK